ncbi:MAG: EamA family transporter [Clostridiales bacterium]|nr:EamA family transporter [Clostridiales bacterium]
MTEKEFGRSKAVVLLIITALLWSMGGLLIKLIPWHPIAIAGSRSAIAALLFFVYVRKPKWTGSSAQLGGAVAYAGTVITFVAATKMTTAANAILLQYTAPVYVALFGAWFLKERTGLADWITVVTVIGGMILFFIDDLSPGYMLGNIFAMLSGMCFAVMVLCLRKQKDGSPLESVLYGNILTAVIALPFLTGQPRLDIAGWVTIAGLGVFQLGLSYIMYTVAIKHVTALDAILIPVVEPILNPVWVLLFIGEVPGSWALLGGVIVLFSVTARCLLPVMCKGKKQPDENIISSEP